MSEATAGAPAYVLIASGVINLIYSVIYLLWTAAVIVLPLIGSIGSIRDGGNSIGSGLRSGSPTGGSAST